MAETILLPEVSAPPQSPPVTGPTRRRRLQALGLVLSVSFTQFVFSASYYAFHPAGAAQKSQLSFVWALISEITSLLLLCYVLSEPGRSWCAIGWNPQWMDVLRAVGLVAVSGAGARLVTTFFQGFYRNYTGHYLQPRSLHGVIGGISALSIVFIVVNPVFEELIVRGFTMSEVTALGGSRNLAIFVSVLIQVSYHVYQGLLHCIALTVAFTVLSVYFSRSRKILPVVLAHFWSDAYGLFRLAS